MSLAPPSLPQLVETNTSTLLHTLAKWALVSKSKFERSIERAFAVAFSNTQHGQYLYAWRLWAQLWPDTAREHWLDRHAKIWGLARKPAQYAAGSIKVFGENGSPIPAGAVLEWKGEGLLFEVVDAAVIANGEAVVSVVAREVGPGSNAMAGAVLRFTEALAGLAPEAEVLVGSDGVSGLVGGLDTETDDDLRARLLLRIAEPPKGGSPADYVLWALEVAGITRAWCVPKYAGPGTVLIMAVNDAANPILPPPEKIAEIGKYLGVVAPATDHRIVSAPTLVQIDHELVLSPNDETTRQAVLAALADHYRRRELGSTVRRSRVSEAISGANGESWHELLAPQADIELGQFEIPVLGAAGQLAVDHDAAIEMHERAELGADARR